MRLRIPLRTLAAGVAASCVTATFLLPASAAVAASTPLTAKAPASGHAAPSAPKPLGATLPGASAPSSADTVPTAAPLTPGQLAQAQRPLPPGVSVQLSPKTEVPAPAPAVRPHADHRAAADTASCTPADFSTRTGSALVSFVEGSTTTCVNTLFNLTGADAGGVFKEAQMLTVANAYHALASGYTGDDSTGIWQLELFLRAGWYVQSNNAAAVGDYDAALTTANQAALDAFFGSAHWRDATAANAQVLYDALVLTDSANLQANYLNVYKQVLNGYTPADDSVTGMDNAVNAVLFAPLWRGNWNPAFVSAVAADPSILSTLGAFALTYKGAASGAAGFLVVNAGNDLGRAAGDGGTVGTAASRQVQAVLGASAITGATAPLWVHTAYDANTYDAADCSTYGTCDLPAKLTAAVLTHQLVCDNRTFETEDLTADELHTVCTSLRGEDTFFHNLVKDSGSVNPYGKTIDLAVFANQADYVTYSWAIFGNDTDNGGETMMDPTDPSNQPVSVMYRKAWNDGFPANVWNLNHEYTHYLDGVYDMKGTFSDELVVPDVWWIEGVAEYESYTYRGTTDTEAMAEAANHTYKLSTIFQNTYDNSDTIRTYPWGYLAVRYMFEKHPDVVAAMLSHFRTGDFQGAYQVYNSIGTGYDADFDSWLTACAAGACYAQGPTALFDSSVDGATVSLHDTSVQTGGGSITGWHWTFGDGSSSDQQNPTHTYKASGTYTVDLTVTDNSGRTASTPASVTVTAGSTLPTCTDPRTDALGQNCSRANVSETAGNTAYFYLWLPAGTSTLTVSSSGGTGTAALYYDPDNWASPSTSTASSTTPGTTAQTLTVTNTTAGYRYVSLYAVTDFSGVTVSTQF
ncbi:collagenase [Streptacidiphilus neutrinimicus]|uniref:collagenase n=1 Tax=Streptacidiphilus neutrinimicus TaxID=105420 RepID=UPI0006947F9B|nr:collagenase [Streptacidiphilus neutrinimicus]